MAQRNGKENDGAVLRSAVGQLTLVEHCLCPLDARTSLVPKFVHETSHGYSSVGERRRASVRVSCPRGLTTEDEFNLWGLLSLTLSQPNPTLNFYGTRHYMLRQLGRIDAKRRGGRQYQQLTESIERLSQVTYLNDGFYDPARNEHRRVSFGFFSYSLPLDLESSRVWRIAWDPIFFDFCLAARSLLTFDFHVYRQLDAASRRLFLFLHKLFWRYRKTPALDANELGVSLLGFSPSLTTAELLVRIARTADRLVAHEVIAKRRGTWFRKHPSDRYMIRFSKGKYFKRPRQRARLASVESPLVEPLKSIGFKPHEIERIIEQFSTHLVQQWSDVTLAALEHRGRAFFIRSPQAYFMDNLQKAAQGTRTPPDWWVELQARENRVQVKHGAQNRESGTANDTVSAGLVLDGLIADGVVRIS